MENREMPILHKPSRLWLKLPFREQRIFGLSVSPDKPKEFFSLRPL
jgi:hypothetical protein